MGIGILNCFMSKHHKEEGKNYIRGIRTSQGQWVENLEEVVEVASDYFDNLFHAGLGD